MNTRIGTLLGSILLLMAAMASAQTVQRVMVTVPFSFVAGSHNLPAGDYTIELNHEKDTMILRSEDRSGNNAVMLANNSEQTANPNQSYAIFRHYGSHYFLAEVWRQGAGQTLTPGDLERELASKQGGGQSRSSTFASVMRNLRNPGGTVFRHSARKLN